MISRDPVAASAEQFDLIIIGGGIYGASALLEASRRGIKALLLEKGDFGHATSWNSLRIVHGGLRYLQKLDLHRFKESVGERSWFLHNFPELVEPLPCLMPLYGEGLKRPSTFRTALWLNDLLSRTRNNTLQMDRCIERGRVLSSAETVELFRDVEQHGLRGGGLWYDAVMRHSQRIIIEMLHWACALGGQAVNYAEVTAVLQRNGVITGVRCLDRVSNQVLEFSATRVMNCAGPWSPDAASLIDPQGSWDRLFEPMLAFNVLLKTPPPSKCALAVSARRPGAQMLFLHPWNGGTIAGTWQAPLQGRVAPPNVTDAEIAAFLSELKDAIPKWKVARDDVVLIYAGLLPARHQGSRELTVRELIHDHATSGGPHGAVSITGIKFTTARLVAEKALRVLYPDDQRTTRYLPNADRRSTVSFDQSGNCLQRLIDADKADAPLVEKLLKEESVVFLDDLLLRRTDWGRDPQQMMDVAQRICALAHWDRRHTEQAIAHIGALLLPSTAQLSGSRPTHQTASIRPA